jgi:hypothetical protein
LKKTRENTIKPKIKRRETFSCFLNKKEKFEKIAKVTFLNCFCFLFQNFSFGQNEILHKFLFKVNFMFQFFFSFKKKIET